MKPAPKRTGRGERIRTPDLSVPNRAHYQAVLRPVSLRANNGRAILASARLDGQGTQEFRGFFQCLTSMTYLVLNVRRQFRECLVKALRNEDRIISEAIFTPWRLRDFSYTKAGRLMKNYAAPV